MIEAIIYQTDEAKKLQLVVYDHIGGTRRVWCESCGQQGHKFYECPEKLLSSSADVWCEICNSNTHPTNDCPNKTNDKDHRGGRGKQFKALPIEDNPDEELHQFLKEVKQGKQQKYKLGIEGDTSLKQITYQPSSEDTSKIEVQVADEEDAEKLQACISLYNKNANEN